MNTTTNTSNLGVVNNQNHSLKSSNLKMSPPKINFQTIDNHVITSINTHCNNKIINKNMNNRNSVLGMNGTKKPMPLLSDLKKYHDKLYSNMKADISNNSSINNSRAKKLNNNTNSNMINDDTKKYQGSNSMNKNDNSSYNNIDIDHYSMKNSSLKSSFSHASKNNSQNTIYNGLINNYKKTKNPSSSIQFEKESPVEINKRPQSNNYNKKININKNEKKQIAIKDKRLDTIKSVELLGNSDDNFEMNNNLIIRKIHNNEKNLQSAAYLGIQEKQGSYIFNSSMTHNGNKNNKNELFKTDKSYQRFEKQQIFLPNIDVIIKSLKYVKFPKNYIDTYKVVLDKIQYSQNDKFLISVFDHKKHYVNIRLFIN